MTEAVFCLLTAQPEGRALGTLALGGGTVTAAHLDGVQGAAALRAGVIGAGVHRAVDAGVGGSFVVHTKLSSLRIRLV